MYVDRSRLWYVSNLEPSGWFCFFFLAGVQRYYWARKQHILFQVSFTKPQPIKQHLLEMSSSYDKHHPCPVLNASHSHPPALEAK